MIVTAALAASALILMSSSNGRSDDRTGAPSSDGTCGSCHSGGSQGTTVTIGVTEKGLLVPVNSYKAGKTYTVAIAVGGLSTRKGFQATVLSASNGKTGTVGEASAGSQIISANSRDIASHTAVSATGLWTFEWTAPSSPTGSVTIYASGNAADGASADNGDQAATASKTLTLDNTSGTGTVDVVAITVFPNPCSDFLILPNQAREISVYALTGSEVPFQAEGNVLDTRNMATGFYYISYSIDNKRVTTKFQKSAH